MQNVSLNNTSSAARGRADNEVYLAQRGDSLSGIAREHGVTLSQLLRANPQILDRDQIAVGQPIRLPQAEASPGKDYSVKAGDTLWDIARQHGVSVRELEVANPQLKADRFQRIFPGDVLRIPSAQAGQVAAEPGLAERLLKLGREWLQQAEQEIDAAGTQLGAAADKLQADVGKLFADKPVTATNTTHPAIPERAPATALRLGDNQAYEASLRAAAARTGSTPEALAAVIDAEAAKQTKRVPVLHTDGSPLLDKHGKPVSRRIQVWNPQSHNPSGAAGLTQFIPGTWLGEAMRRGTFLNEKAIERGWVRLEADAKGRERPVFVLADGKTTTEPFDRRYAGDANVKALLAERYNADWSINAAADYGAANLARLEQAGFKLDGLSAGERAKLMYLMHHEGEGNGPLFIRGELDAMPKRRFASSEARLTSIFAQQVGADKAALLTRLAGGDVQQAYRGWLSAYIDNKIDVSRFANQPKTTALSSLLEKIGGKALP